MNARANSIDLVKLLKYVLKRLWFVVLCAEVGFGAVYMYMARYQTDTYTATGTMYVNNINPNLIEYQYTNYSDLSTALKLIDTYMVVVKSDQVMNTIVNKLSATHPGITSGQVSPTLFMASVSDTGVVAVKSRTNDPQLAADIVNTVLDEAPNEIIRVVGAGSIEIIDYAKVPIFPDGRGSTRKGMQGALYGAVVALCVLTVLFMLNKRVTVKKDLTDNYKLPVLASIKRQQNTTNNPQAFILTSQSPMEIIEGYAKLRMNLLYTLVDKSSKCVVVTSSISGEGKTTIAANLAISCAMSGKKVLLIDGDLRRACQRDIFDFDKHAKGLSDILIGNATWQKAILCNVSETLDLLPAGRFPPNPAELLQSKEMISLLNELENVYDLILIDMPPINIVADPLVLSGSVAGCLFVTRQDFSDHRDIRKALIEAEMTGMNVLGFVFYGENVSEGGYYSYRYYRKYYHKYDYRRNPVGQAGTAHITPDDVENSINETLE